MVHWARILASALLAAPATLPAQPGGGAPVEPPRVIEAKPTSPAAEIAAAATACMGALGKNGLDSSAMERSGWPLADMLGEAHVHRRDGSNVRVVTTTMGGGQCIVDAYGEQAGGFDSIRDAVRAGLRARFGSSAALASSTGAEGDFSRGQGFRVGKRIGVLSSEQRPDGLSIRFTAMTLR